MIVIRIYTQFAAAGGIRTEARAPIATGTSRQGHRQCELAIGIGIPADPRADRGPFQCRPRTQAAAIRTSPAPLGLLPGHGASSQAASKPWARPQRTEDALCITYHNFSVKD